MKLRLLTLLASGLLAAGPASAQTVKSLGYNTTNGFIVYSGTNPLTFTNSLQFATNARAATRTNLGGTTVGNAVFTATNAAAGATALELGATNNVTFNNLTTSGTLTATGNVTLSGVGNTAPSQTASSGASLMTRDLSDDRYSFSRWYDANDLLSAAQNVGANPLITGTVSGSHVVAATLVTVSNVNTKFMLPVDYRMSGEVKVVSYWTDRNLTNGGTNGDIAVWTLPFVVQPTTDTATSGIVNGTTIQSAFTANYGGSGNARYYVMEQTLNFATVTNISATNPMQLKWVELQRRAADASDTSGDNIYLSGVHIYVP
jgi:hypothetical protein